MANVVLEFMKLESLRGQLKEIQTENEHLKSKPLDLGWQRIGFGPDLKLKVEKLTKVRELVEATLRKRDDADCTHRETMRLLKEKEEAGKHTLRKIARPFMRYNLRLILKSFMKYKMTQKMI
ncbi:hypothetical protein Tco_0719374 [Tanacetum coccineum]